MERLRSRRRKTEARTGATDYARAAAVLARQFPRGMSERTGAFLRGEDGTFAREV